jgi:ammonia channel protein AmtB
LNEQKQLTLQRSWQLAGAVAGFAWSFFVTLILLIIVQLLSTCFPSLELRAKGSGSTQIDLDDEELADTNAVRATFLFAPSPTLINLLLYNWQDGF